MKHKLNASHTYSQRGNKGFTLIEVLIASIILFSAIALVAELFSASSLSSKKAAKIAQYNQTIPLVNRMIKADIQQRAKDRSLSNMQGSVMFLDIEFNWQANRTSFLSPAMSANDEVRWSPRFGLFTVLVSTKQSAGQKVKQGEYSFQVATW